MKLDYIKATNFKSLKNFELEPTNKITVLTGNNGKGKTTVTELIRYGLTGTLPENPITSGEEELQVEVKLASGTCFTRSVHETKPSKITVCGKSSTLKNLSELLESETGVRQSVAKIVSSADVVSNMKPEELGQLFLSYIPEELDFDTVTSYIPGITPDAVVELSQILPGMPENFGTNTLSEAYDAFMEIRKETKRERDACKIRAAAYVGEPPTKKLSDVEKELEEIMKLEGAKDAYIAQEKAYKQAVELAERQKSEIDRLQKEIDMNKATKPNENTLKSIQEKAKECSSEIIETEKLITMLENMLEVLNKTVEDLDKPVCPISSKLICSTDRTYVKDELLVTIKDNEEGLAYQKDKNKKLHKLMESFEQQEEEYRKNVSGYEKKIALIQQLNNLQKNPIIVPAKPSQVTFEDCSEAKEKVKKEMERIKLYETTEKEKALLETFEKRVQTYDLIVNVLAPKGIVMESITRHYISIFEGICNNRAKALKPDFLIKFVYEDGVKVYCQPKANAEFLPYANLSQGEKAVTLFLLLDMLNALSGLNILILDDLEKLDKNMFDSLISLISDTTVQDDYDHIILCAVDHEDTVKTIQKLNNVQWIKM